jgi:hypothetical protein
MRTRFAPLLWLAVMAFVAAGCVGTVSVPVSEVEYSDGTTVRTPDGDVPVKDIERIEPIAPPGRRYRAMGPSSFIVSDQTNGPDAHMAVSGPLRILRGDGRVRVVGANGVLSMRDEQVSSFRIDFAQPHRTKIAIGVGVGATLGAVLIASLAGLASSLKGLGTVGSGWVP